MNPEFRRYLWIELSPQRLIVMPVVLATCFILVGMGATYYRVAVSDAAVFLYSLLIFFWSTRRAAASVASELRDGTWDAQRMSAQGAFALSWGKLFGSTVYPWYGALLCLAVYLLVVFGVVPTAATGVPFMPGQPSPASLLKAFDLIVAGIAGQAVALAAALAYVRKRRDRRNVPVTFCHVLGLVVALLLYYWVARGALQMATLDWYGRTFDRPGFLAVSALAFLLWALVAVLRLMRVELLYRVRPWAWTAFAVYLSFWSIGLMHQVLGATALTDLTLLSWLVPPFVITAGLIYPAFLLDEKNQVGLAAWFRALAAGRLARAAADAPAWGQLFALALLLALAILVVAGLRRPQVLMYEIDASSLSILVLAAVLFLLRDLALLLLLNMGKGQRRADGAGVIYLIVLYGLVPPLAKAIGGAQWQALFLPIHADLPLPALVGPAVQALAMIGLLGWRTRRTVGLAAAS